MKKLSNLLLVVGFLFASIFSAQAADLDEKQLVAEAKKDPVLNLATNGLSYPDVLKAAFLKKYPFIKISHVYLANTSGAIKIEDFYESLFIGSDRNKLMDVVMRCQEPTFQYTVDSNWLMPLSDLPEWANRPVTSYGKDNRYVNFIGAPHGFVYNADLLKEADLPKSYEELLDSKWKGKVGLRSPLKGNSGAFLVEYIYNTFGNLSWYAGMAKNKAYMSQSGRDLHSMVSSGKYVLAVSRDVEWLRQHTRFPNLKFKFFESTLPFQYQIAMINANAPHPAAAKLFMNFVLKEGIDALDKEGFSVSARQAAHKKHAAGIWELPPTAIPAHKARLQEAVRLMQENGATIGAETASSQD